jgi:streptogramin lyase
VHRHVFGCPTAIPVVDLLKFQVDVGADGRVYLAEAGAGRVIAFDPKDGSKSVIAEGLKMGLPAAEGALPAYTTSGVAVSKKDGSVYVASDITNAIYRIAPPAE